MGKKKVANAPNAYIYVQEQCALDPSQYHNFIIDQDSLWVMENTLRAPEMKTTNFSFTIRHESP
jgi:hypothetical protein